MTIEASRPLRDLLRLRLVPDVLFERLDLYVGDGPIFEVIFERRPYSPRNVVARLSPDVVDEPRYHHDVFPGIGCRRLHGLLFGLRLRGLRDRESPQPPVGVAGGTVGFGVCVGVGTASARGTSPSPFESIAVATAMPTTMTSPPANPITQGLREDATVDCGTASCDGSSAESSAGGCLPDGFRLLFTDG